MILFAIKLQQRWWLILRRLTFQFLPPPDCSLTLKVKVTVKSWWWTKTHLLKLYIQTRDFSEVVQLLKMAEKGWNIVFEPKNTHFLIKRGGMTGEKTTDEKKESQLPLALQLVKGAKGCLFHWHWAIQTGVNVMGIKCWNEERKA